MAKAVSTSKQEPSEKERTTVYMKHETNRKLKYVCFKSEISQTDAIDEALQDYFKKWEIKNGKIKI